MCEKNIEYFKYIFILDLYLRDECFYLKDEISMRHICIPSIARNISDTKELVASPSFISNIRRSFLDAIFMYISKPS